MSKDVGILYKAWALLNHPVGDHAPHYRKEVINGHTTFSGFERSCARFLKGLGPEFSDLDPMNGKVKAAYREILAEDKSVDPYAEAYLRSKTRLRPGYKKIKAIKERIREAHPYPEATGELKWSNRGSHYNYSKWAREPKA